VVLQRQYCHENGQARVITRIVLACFRRAFFTDVMFMDVQLFFF